MIFAVGWYLETKRAVSPVSDRTMIAFAPMSHAVFTAEEAAASAWLVRPAFSFICWKMRSYPVLSFSTNMVSASMHVRDMISTAARGKEPLAVSPESMTASAPSRTAFATSEHSARVGRGLVIIDSSICVATTHGLPALRHLTIISFCSRKTFSGGISIPRSPRATMTPSVSSRISSNLSRPSWFSIFEMILMLFPASPRISRM
mmetsp:Transcript_60416/g.134648  ORF Transcript_60416/g.134648 Transcript_60416/m.134648 type:complete len:204 (+) Transcript_60416:958-1569(+)